MLINDPPELIWNLEKLSFPMRLYALICEGEHVPKIKIIKISISTIEEYSDDVKNGSI